MRNIFSRLTQTQDARALKLVGDILYHLRSLGELDSQRVLDYSALQPLANQIAVMSEDLPGAFASFRNCALKLKDATTLSSGLGMNQIWSMLYENSFAVNEILRLEKLAVQIDGPFGKAFFHLPQIPDTQTVCRPQETVVEFDGNGTFISFNGTRDFRQQTDRNAATSKYPSNGLRADADYPCSVFRLISKSA